ncbi:MAG: hypothetical protein ACREXW_19585 [Gammaproteobacteria bacterium]
MDVRALPLVLVRTPAADLDRTMETEDPWLKVRAPAPSDGLYTTRPQSGITEHPPVSQASVPIPDRPRLRLSKREWAGLIERLSRLIRHRLAIDLDRRGIRLWR